ncbi:MAG: hypothetical protein GXO57_09200 [Thermodesulfobacteria bacterium]|nr:hypothetical protein [Thermodesulfobacteriota bacterium]
MPQRISLIRIVMILFLLSLCSFKEAVAVRYVFSLSKGPFGKKLKNPGDFTFRNDRFYVVDTGNKRLISYSLSGKPLVAFNPEGKLKEPIDLAFIGESLIVVDEALGGIYWIDFEKRRVTPYLIRYHGEQIYPKAIQVVKNFLYVLDFKTGKVFKFKVLSNGTLKGIKAIYPKKESFKGFIDFRVVQSGFWGLSRLERRIYHYYNGKWESFSLKGKCFAPVSLEVRFNDVFVLDRYLCKVFVFRLPDFKEVGEFGKKGRNSGFLYNPVKIRYLHYNYIGIGDEGNGRVDIFRY